MNKTLQRLLDIEPKFDILFKCGVDRWFQIAGIIPGILNSRFKANENRVIPFHEKSTTYVEKLYFQISILCSASIQETS
jgi:hypothetical protein